ncbi:hypothetical protein DAT299_07220 [Streptococcus suis]|nr:hypothetical protein DAT299_07220 [Streptococcus suis]GAW38651.1 uncharacterized protein TANIYAMA1_1434 [Streptococcus suis]
MLILSRKSRIEKIKQVFKKYLIFIKLNIDFIKIKCKIILNKYLIDVQGDVYEKVDSQ